MQRHSSQDVFAIGPEKITVGTDAPSSSECLAQVERLVCSPILLGSEYLCKLLRYLADHTLNSPSSHLKEYQIATEAFGRPTDFDPQVDPCVRVQAGRLRAKLDQYYGSEGIHDRIRVSVNKGRYALLFQRNAPAVVTDAKMQEPNVLPNRSPTESRGNHNHLQVWLLCLAGLLLTAATIIFISRGGLARRSGLRTVTDTNQSSIQTFWDPFLHQADEPFVVFSNATFVGTAEAGMRYYEPSRDSGKPTIQHYTGIGEVIGTVELDRLFQQKLGHSFYLKPAGMFTLDDAQKRNLIFVGSAKENLQLEKISTSHNFAISRLATGPDQGKTAIVNLHPLPGEPALFFPTPKPLPLAVDYAVIALVHGLDSSHWTLILEGATTVGTEAAVDFVCNENSLTELLHHLDVKTGTRIKPFEALLRVKVSNDVPLESQLALVHRVE